MNTKDILEDINQAMNCLQNVDCHSMQSIKRNAKNIHKAYEILDLLKEKLSDLESHCIMTCQYNRGRLKEEHEIILELLSKYKEQIAELERKNKIINYMSKEMYLEMPVEFYNNRKISLQTIEGIKRYFERKVEDVEKEDLRLAVLTYRSLLWFTNQDVEELYKSSNKALFEKMRYETNVKKYQEALKQQPWKWLGNENIPRNNTIS